MKLTVNLALVLTIVSAPGTADDEWLGLEPEQPILIGFDLGQDEVEDLSAAFVLSLPLGNSAGYYGYYGNTELSDDGQEFDSLNLATVIWFELSELIELEVQHFFEGNTDELEKETLGLSLALSRGDWNFRVQLEDGDLLIFTNDDIGDFLDRFVPDRFDSDVSAYALALGRQVDPWYWQISYQRYDYEEDLTPLGSSLFAQFIFKSSALTHSSLLISRSTSVMLGLADYDNDYSITIYQDESAIDDSEEESLLLSWQHWANQQLGYLFAASIPVPGDSIGVTLGLRWVL